METMEPENIITVTLTHANASEIIAALAEQCNYYRDCCRDDDSLLNSTVAQLRDELAAVKAKYDAADEALCCIAKTVNDTDIYVIESIDDDVAKVVRELKQRAERAESEAQSILDHMPKDVSIVANEGVFASLAASVSVLADLRSKAIKERDELKAKLEQPRMFMRDGQLWEAISQSIHDKLPAPAGQWQFFGTLDTEQTIYRRPITPQELQGWIEPQGEVLFEGVRWVSKNCLDYITSGRFDYPSYYDKDDDRTNRVELSIVITRKAGE